MSVKKKAAIKLRNIANVNKVHSISSTARPKRGWGRNFDNSSGFSIKLPRNRGANIFIDRRFVHGDKTKRTSMMEKGLDIAHVVTCSGVTWDIKSEPIGPGKVGFIVYTSKGKPIGAGTGKIQENGSVQYKVASLYDGITNKVNVTFKAEGKLNSDGSYSGTVSVSASTDIC